MRQVVKMSVNKTAMALLAMAMLTGCSSSNEKPLDIGHGGQVEQVDTSTSAYHQKDVNSFNNANNSRNSDKGFDSQFQEIKNNQANTNTVTGSLAKHTIYFLYDGSEVEPDFIPLIRQYSQDLSDNPDQTLVLEGHADERGSREYNIALAEERAKAVAKMMQARGVRSRQLEIVSYGEENPASFEHSETAWHLNRRVNLITQRNQK